MKNVRFIMIVSAILSIVGLIIFTIASHNAYAFIKSIDISQQEDHIGRKCVEEKTILGVINLSNICEPTTEGGDGENASDVTTGSGPARKLPKDTAASGKVETAYEFDLGSNSASPVKNIVFYVVCGAAGLLAIVILKKLFDQRSKKVASFTKRTINKTQKNSPLFKFREESSTLPEEYIRRQLVLFERQLPIENRRRPEESVTEWTNRIGLNASILPYLESRYNPKHVDNEKVYSSFQNILDSYLSRTLKENNS